MKKLLLFLLIVTVIFLINSCITRKIPVNSVIPQESPGNWDKKTLKIVTVEWPPYTEENSPQKGIITEMISAIFKNMGRKIEIEFVPTFDFAYKQTERNKYDGAFPFEENKDRRKKMHFSQKIFEYNSSFFYNNSILDNKSSKKNELIDKIRKGETENLEINELNDYCVGLVKFYNYGGKREDLDKLDKTRVFPTEFSGFQSLVEEKKLQDVKTENDSCNNDKTVFFPSEEEVGDTILNNYFSGKVDKISKFKIKNMNKIPVHFITPKENSNDEKLIEDFNSYLKELKENGILESIKRRYELQNSHTSNFVILKSVLPNYPLVIGYDFEPTNTEISKKCQSNFNLRPGFLEEKQDIYDESCSFLIPNNTKAFVLEWDTGFEPPGNSKNNKQIDASKVRILQGPRKDKIIYVPNVYISFE